MSAPVLELAGLTRRYAGLVAVDEVELAVQPGTVHAVIGPNGAGKTTLFNLISGIVVPSEGTIRFLGQDVTAAPPFKRAAAGMGRTFQNIRIFAEMTVLENVLTGLAPGFTGGLLAVVAMLPGLRRAEREARTRALEVLDIVGLADRAHVPAASLPYGDQRRLEIARALASAPRLILLDEPAAGMNPAETVALGALVRRIRDAGTTVLLVEHDMGFVMELSDRVTVLNFGRRIFEGAPDTVKREPTVIEAYLGPKVATRLAGVTT